MISLLQVSKYTVKHDFICNKINYFRHDIAEILLKVALKQKKSNQIKWIVQNKQNITYK
jgi:hypothetical protein